MPLTTFSHFCVIVWPTLLRRVTTSTRGDPRPTRRPLGSAPQLCTVYQASPPSTACYHRVNSGAASRRPVAAAAAARRPATATGDPGPPRRAACTGPTTGEASSGDWWHQQWRLVAPAVATGGTSSDDWWHQQWRLVAPAVVTGGDQWRQESDHRPLRPSAASPA